MKLTNTAKYTGGFIGGPRVFMQWWECFFSSHWQDVSLSTWRRLSRWIQLVLFSDVAVEDGWSDFHLQALVANRRWSWCFVSMQCGNPLWYMHEYIPSHMDTLWIHWFSPLYCNLTSVVITHFVISKEHYTFCYFEITLLTFYSV